LIHAPAVWLQAHLHAARDLASLPQPHQPNRLPSVLSDLNRHHMVPEVEVRPKYERLEFRSKA